MKKRRIIVFLPAILALALVSALIFGLSCESNPANNGNGPGRNDPAWNVDLSWTPDGACTERAADVPDKNAPDLGLGDDYVIVTFRDGADAEVEYANDQLMAVLTAEVSGGHVVINNSLTSGSPFIISVIANGTTQNGSLKIYSGLQMALYLNGVTIKNPAGPAINIQGRRMTVNLVGGCDRKNYLEGRGLETLEGQEQAKGAFFSENTLEFSGGGFLEVRSKGRHAIISDGHIRIDNVDIVIPESESDGIHANDDIELFKNAAGTLRILSAGDAIQNERSQNATGVSVYDGEIKIRTTGPKSHGIASEKDVFVGGNAKITIVAAGAASKGFRARSNVTISGGEVDISTSGGQLVARPGDPDYDPDDTTSSAAGIKALYFDMTGGSYRSVNIGDNSKGINIANDAMITGGEIDIRAHGDGIKVDGNLTISGGNTEVRTESATKKGIDCKGNANMTGKVERIDESGAIR